VTFSLTSLAVVAATGFAAPLLIELLPGLHLPNVVAEIGALTLLRRSGGAPAAEGFEQVPLGVLR